RTTVPPGPVSRAPAGRMPSPGSPPRPNPPATRPCPCPDPRRLDLDPALPDRVDHRLGAVADAQLAEDRGDVVLDRLLADEQTLADLPVGDALRHQLQDLELAAGEGLGDAPAQGGPPLAAAGSQLQHARRKGRVHVALAPAAEAHRLDQRPRLHVLEHEAA